MACAEGGRQTAQQKGKGKELADDDVDDGALLPIKVGGWTCVVAQTRLF